MTRLLDYKVITDKGYSTLMIINHKEQRAFMRSNDASVIQERVKEMHADMQRASRSDILIGMYRHANEKGCIHANTNEPSIPVTGFLKIRIIKGTEYGLFLTYRSKEVLVKRDSLEKVQGDYITLMKKQAKDPDLFMKIWEFAKKKKEAVSV